MKNVGPCLGLTLIEGDFGETLGISHTRIPTHKILLKFKKVFSFFDHVLNETSQICSLEER